MARPWETIIAYEDRADHLTTSRWRLSGVCTRETGGNTDDGTLWLVTTKSGDTVTATLHKNAACSASVASGTADVSSTDNTGANAAQVTLTAANSSGLSGSFWIHNYADDDTCPVQVCLCVDEDLDLFFDGIEDLPGYDTAYGAAEFIRAAGEECVGRVMTLYRDQLGGHGDSEAWYITDASRVYPDLRRIANPRQLRHACAHLALSNALLRHHQRASDTMYSDLADRHRALYEDLMSSLVLAVKSGSGDNAEASKGVTVIRQSRV